MPIDSKGHRLYEKMSFCDLAHFWICCSFRHSEQTSQWAELNLMSHFRATSLKRSRFNMQKYKFVCVTHIQPTITYIELKKLIFLHVKSEPFKACSKKTIH